MIGKSRLSHFTEGRLGRVVHQSVITLDWDQAAQYLNTMVNCRTSWAEVEDGTRDTVLKLRGHGVIPPDTAQRIYKRLDSVDQTISTVVRLLQRFESCCGW